MRCLLRASALLLAIATTTHCTTDSSTSYGDVQTSRYRADLERIAAGSREPGSAHWQVVQDLCADHLEGLGYEVTRHSYGSGVNVIGRLPGSSRPDEQVIVSAHYDSVPDCIGADDNGTGVAGVFESARVLASDGPHARTLIMACWDEEELGLKGSRAYAAEAKDRGDEIIIAYVYEMLGYRSDEPNSQQIPSGLDELYPEQYQAVADDGFRGNFIAIVHDESPTGAAAAGAYAQAAQQLSLPLITLDAPSGPMGVLIGNLMRSDHAAFWLQGYSGMMITDSANFRNDHYHCTAGEDSVDRLDHDFASKAIAATVAAARATLNP